MRSPICNKQRKIADQFEQLNKRKRAQPGTQPHNNGRRDNDKFFRDRPTG
jgi:hypothetical protein